MSELEELFRRERAEHKLYCELKLSRELRHMYESFVGGLLFALTVGVILLGVSISKAIVAVVINSPNAAIQIDRTLYPLEKREP